MTARGLSFPRHTEASHKPLAPEPGLSPATGNWPTRRHLIVSRGGTRGDERVYDRATWATQASPEDRTSGNSSTCESRPKPSDRQEQERKKDPVRAPDVGEHIPDPLPAPLSPGIGEGLRTWHRTSAQTSPRSSRGHRCRMPLQQTQAPRKPRGEGLYTLGKLCKRGHEHEGTGQSLRRLPSGSCLQCDLERQEAKRQANVQVRREARPPRRIIDLSAHRQRQEG